MTADPRDYPTEDERLDNASLLLGWCSHCGHYRGTHYEASDRRGSACGYPHCGCVNYRDEKR